MSASAMPLIILSRVMTAFSQIQQGRAMSAAAKYNAAVAESSAGAIRASSEFERRTLVQKSEFERKALEQQSAVERAKILRAKTRMTSEQRARYAKSGVRVDVGSPLEVMADTAAQYELDLAANRYNLALGKTRIGYETTVGKERIRYETSGAIARTKAEAAYQGLMAKQYKQAGYWGAGATLLTTMGTVKALGGFDRVPKTYGGPMGRSKVIRFRGI